MQALVATVDSIDAFSLLQNMAPMSYDSSRLVDVACIAYAHVDAAHIKELRGKYLATVQRQFQVAALQPAVHLSVHPGTGFTLYPTEFGDVPSVPARQLSDIARLRTDPNLHAMACLLKPL